MEVTTPTKEKVFPEEEKGALPKPFIMRRLHSLLGLWLAIYLFEHLFVNSQAALFLHDNGLKFVALVNGIHNIPYLKVVELLILAIPFLIHGSWGMLYALTGKMNAKVTDGRTPSLPQFKRNRAYSWQRVTSWILVVGIIAHVVQMRFLDNPYLVMHDQTRLYLLKLEADPALANVAKKLNVDLYTPEQLAQLNEKELKWVEEQRFKKGEVVAVSPSAGAAFFLVVRQTFKSPLMVILYSILVIAACYHGYNGLWTFMITWGATLTRRSQAIFRKFCQGLIILVSFLGLMAAWGTYFIIQFQK